MKKHFITGLVFLLPFALTVSILVFCINLLTNPFLEFTKNLLLSFNIQATNFLFLGSKQTLVFLSKILILCSLVLFTVLLGIITRWYFLHKLIRLGDYFLHRIPLINKLYKTSQDIIQTLFASQSDAFKQVVMVPFPTPNIFCIGLITKNAPLECRKSASCNLVSVFVPTTPNPTSGYLLMFKKEDLHFLDMAVEDAVKFIVSCGVIYPGSQDSPASSPSLTGLPISELKQDPSTKDSVVND